MRTITIRQSKAIALEPSFITFSSPGGSFLNAYGNFFRRNQIKLEVVLSDILPPKNQIMPVERVCGCNVKHGWHYDLTWKQVDKYEKIVRYMGYSKYLRSKGLIN